MYTLEGQTVLSIIVLLLTVYSPCIDHCELYVRGQTILGNFEPTVEPLSNIPNPPPLTLIFCVCTRLLVNLVPHLLLSWRTLKKLGGKFSFCLFLHLLHLYLTAFDAASLRGRRGRYARTPSGSCARFYYITRGFLMSGEEKKLGVQKVRQESSKCGTKFSVYTHRR